jgi:hypothetical protein
MDPPLTHNDYIVACISCLKLLFQQECLWDDYGREITSTVIKTTKDLLNRWFLILYNALYFRKSSMSRSRDSYCLAFIGCHCKLNKSCTLVQMSTPAILLNSTSCRIRKLAQRCKARLQISQYHEEFSKLLVSNNLDDASLAEIALKSLVSV